MYTLIEYRTSLSEAKTETKILGTFASYRAASSAQGSEADYTWPSPYTHYASRRIVQFGPEIS